MKKIIVALSFASSILLSANSASALEFRKCGIEAVISGVGIPVTPIIGSSFVGWARAKSGSRAARQIEKISYNCLKASLARDAQVVPGGCDSNQSKLRNKNARGSGASGFKLTRGFTAIKNTICNNPSIGSRFSRTTADKLYDKRIIDGFSISFRKTSGNGGCRGRGIQPAVTLTILCNAGDDMVRYEKPPHRLYRQSKWPVPPACKKPFSARNSGATVREAKRNVAKWWISNVSRNHGQGFANFKNALNKDYKCLKKLQGNLPVECVLKATPCYF